MSMVPGSSIEFMTKPDVNDSNIPKIRFFVN